MNNLERLQEFRKTKGWPTLLVTNADNVGWATGFTGSFGAILVGDSKPVFITDSRYTIQAKEQVKGADIKSFASPKTFPITLAETLTEMGVTEIGFESEFVTYANYEKWSKDLAAVKLTGVGDMIFPLRSVKTADEVDKIRRACKLADACFDHILKLIKPGVVEYDLQLEIEFYFRRNGAGLAFEPIVVSGEKSARPHGRAGEKKLEHGDFLTMDFGANLDGYNSDITRTVVIGKATDRHKEIYSTVLKSQLAALDMMKPGISAKTVDDKVREVMNEKDLAKYFGHGLGHGLGRNVHDGGGIGQASNFNLEKGQVWTVEPGVYIEGYGGVRIEDDVVMTEDGIEILNHSTKELLEIS